MKKIKNIIIFSFFVLIISILSACSANPDQVDKVVREEGQKVYLLNNKEESQKTDNTVGVGLLSISKIAAADAGFFLESGNIILVRNEPEKGSQFYIYNKTGDEDFFVDFKLGDNFHISPDGRKLLFATDEHIYVIYVEKSLQRKGPGVEYQNMIPYLNIDRIEWMNRDNDYIHSSLAWLDSSRIVYSDRDGNVYSRSLDGEYFKKYILDSNFKLNISEVGDRLVYIKNRGYKNLELEINEPSYDRFLQKQKGNYLAYAKKDKGNGIIIDRENELHIKKYRISPDRRKIALYFEDENNNGLLAITDFHFKLYYNNLVHVSNELISDFIWSPDSDFLLYNTSEAIPGLYVVNRDGDGNRQLGANKRLSFLNWSNSEKALLAVDRGGTESNIYKIVLREIQNEEK